MATNLRLEIAPCSYKAAQYAVMHWHYSRTMPSAKLSKYGVWEDNRFIGAVIFGSGACPQAHCPYGITRHEVCELVRVALSEHKSTVSHIVAIALRLLKKDCPGLRLVVSFSDPEQGHVGKIYQAGNWVYCGQAKGGERVMLNGKERHDNSVRKGRPGFLAALKRAGIATSRYVWKYRYLMPLDRAMRKQIEPLRQPYPKRLPEGGTLPTEKGGLIPTQPLQTVTA